MYTTITVAVDNSPHAGYAEQLGLQIALPLRTPVKGVHAYTGKFHEARFRALEEHLPEKYRNEETLSHQRDIHSVLIGRGLSLISLEYLKRLSDACGAAGVPFTEAIVDGKNADVVIGAADYGCLTVMGAEGLGRVEGAGGLGSTTRRTLRSGTSDLLIAKKAGPIRTVLAGIDGSAEAFAMAGVAADLAKHLGADLTFAAGFDPGLHRTVFGSLSATLPKEAGSVFRFAEQEDLHNAVIDKSLADLYSRHLAKSSAIAREHGIPVTTRLLQGKPYAVLCTLAQELDADLIVVGHSGMHRSRWSGIGSNTERIAELAKTNVLVVRDRLHDAPAPGEGGSIAGPPPELPSAGTPDLVWNDDAKRRLENVPKFARAMAVLAIERYAKERKIATITPEVMAAAREEMGS